MPRYLIGKGTEAGLCADQTEPKLRQPDRIGCLRPKVRGLERRDVSAAQRALPDSTAIWTSPRVQATGGPGLCGSRPHCGLGHWGSRPWWVHTMVGTRPLGIQATVGPDHWGSSPWWGPDHWGSRPWWVHTTVGSRPLGVQATVGSSKSPFGRWRSSSLSSQLQPTAQ